MNRPVEWDKHSDDAFERWATGKTGIPFVDANMRELNQTGFMSNRGRQNVASFLTKYLNVDWRRGAAYFESKLIDYDVSANWGNWAYVAGVGNDPRNRYFNVELQGKRYDPQGHFVKCWCPELSKLPPRLVHCPWKLSKQDESLYNVSIGVTYPNPMINLESTINRLKRVKK